MLFCSLEEITSKRSECLYLRAVISETQGIHHQRFLGTFEKEKKKKKAPGYAAMYLTAYIEVEKGALEARLDRLTQETCLIAQNGNTYLRS